MNRNRTVLAGMVALAHELMNVPGAAGMAPAGAAPPQGVMSTAVRPDVSSDWPEGDLPEQMLGDFSILMPSISVFQMPRDIAGLWHTIEAEDTNPRSKTKGQKVIRRMLKFDRSNPLVIVEGPNSGDVLTANFSTHPRARGKKTDPSTQWVSDIAYLLVVALQDNSRPVGDEAIEKRINEYAAAGRTIRLQHGLSGQCRPDKVVRLEFIDPTDTTYAAEGRQPRTVMLDDPQGRKGCGARYYTRDFKNPTPTSLKDQYFTEVQCDHDVQVIDPATNTPVTMKCNAIVRGFPSVDGFLPPLGVGK